MINHLYGISSPDAQYLVSLNTQASTGCVLSLSQYAYPSFIQIFLSDDGLYTTNESQKLHTGTEIQSEEFILPA